MARAKRVRRIHPKKFALWVGILGMIMMFTALTSAYIVRKAAGNWLPVELPQEFFISTAVILASSLLLHLGYKAYTEKKYSLFQSLLIISFILGVGFVALQYQGWLVLNENGVFLTTNASSSFLGIIVGLHAMHVLAGIFALTLGLLYALNPKTKEWSAKRQLRLELICTFWHFVDVLWIYLLIFFLIK